MGSYLTRFAKWPFRGSAYPTLPNEQTSWFRTESFVTEVRFRREGNGVSGQALQKPRMKSCGVCALGCSAFRGSDRFTVTRSVQKGTGISFSCRDDLYQFARYTPHSKTIGLDGAAKVRFGHDVHPRASGTRVDCLWKKERLSGLGRAMPFFVAGRGDCPHAPSNQRISRSSQRSGEA